MSDIKTVDFYGQEIETFEHDSKRWVSLTSVCQGMGVDDKTQRRKVLSQPEKYLPGHMTLQVGGQGREVVGIPVDRLDTWLFSINANRVREDLRANVIKYQEECSQVLHNYWSNGIAINPRIGDPRWQAERASGRAIRNEETDVIKQFVEYAYEQGSQNAHQYYRNLTRATYKGLELIEKYHDECRDLRETLEISDLTLLSMAELQVQKVLVKCIGLGMPYKEIYKAARDEVIELYGFTTRTRKWEV